MNDLIERLRKHVATYKTLTLHRQDCLDIADALEQAQKHIQKLEETKYVPPALEVIDGVMSDKSQNADWLRARYFEGTERIEQLEAVLQRIAGSGIENNYAWSWIGGTAKQILGNGGIEG